MPSRPDDRTITFRFRPPYDTPFVDLRGELAHFRHPIPLRVGPDGVAETTLDVAPGTYAYKFRTADGAWHADPANPRTRSAGGLRNSVAVVGGTDEPVLHAPATPWIRREDDGRLFVSAGLRKGFGESLAIVWDEGHGPAARPMDPVAVEDEHVLFATHLPQSSGRFSYVFRLADGSLVGSPGGGAQWLAASPGEARAPAWWRDAVLYTVFVDRFRRGGNDGRWAVEPGPDDDGPAGGDLAGVCEALPDLKDLGVSVLHLTPIWVAHSAHRYDVVDPWTVDPALGGEAALRRLLEAAHGVGIRVLLDLTLTHVHRDFAPFRDVRARGPRSPWWDWFDCRRFPFAEGMDPGYRHYQKKQWEEPLLRLDHPAVADHLVSVFEHWTRAGADGFRVDAACDVPADLAGRIADAVRAITPDAVLVGEVIAENQYRWVSGLHSPGRLDAATDFLVQEALYDWLWRRSARATDVADRLVERDLRRGGPTWSRVAFAGTHDQPRFLTLTGDPRAARLALLTVLTLPGVPALLYGDEVGLTGGVPDRAFEDAWPDRRCMPWDEGVRDLATRALVRGTIRARRASPALSRGDLAFLEPTAPWDGAPAGDVLAFRRVHGDDTVDVLLNGGADEALLALPDGAGPGVETLAVLGDAVADAGAGVVRLGPLSGLVIRRLPSPEAAALWTRMREAGPRIADAAFREGLVQTASLPTRLYLTATEACNLRCRHCINGSPGRTSDGRARSLRPWVVERLAEALAAASYVGFTHGGESLVHPGFPGILDAIRAARRDATGRTDVHLLSNGMRLDLPAVRRLAAAGVTSLGVSFDGATSEVNDAIRAGSRLETILANVRAAVAWRDAAGADLRIGLSFVATTENVRQLADAGRIALDLGVDWLKIEEMFGANTFARVREIPVGDRRLHEAMATLRAVVEGTRLVLVDHLDDPPGCPCLDGDDPVGRERRAADDFANRASFRSCRMPWEQACVDPDGTVHPVDYSYPALGNLLDEPFLDLWNGPVAQAVRLRALARTPEAVRRACP